MYLPLAFFFGQHLKDSTKAVFKGIKITLLFFLVIEITAAQDFQPQEIQLEYRMTESGPLIGRKIQLPDSLSKNWELRNDTFILKCSWDGYDQRYKVQLNALLPMYLEEARMYVNHNVNTKALKYLTNGFQSWTTTRALGIFEKIKKLSILLNPYSKHAGDYYLIENKEIRKHPYSWNWTYWRGQNKYQAFFSLNEGDGFTLFSFPRLGEVLIIKDVAGYTLLADHSFHLFDLRYGQLPDYAGLDDWFYESASLWHEEHPEASRATAPAASGWTSWYHYYLDISEEIVLNNLQAFQAKELPIDYIQIDDGYQTRTGDWLSINKKFPSGMKALADSIHAAGYKAGLWIAPFVALRQSQLFQEHPDWFVKDARGKPLRIARNVLWKGRYYALDIYHPEARAHIKKVLQTMVQDWGFDLIKADFLFAVCVQPRTNRTRGQIMQDAMLLLREAIGEEAKLLACGVPLAQAYGLADYCRIGNDVHLGWEMGVLKALRAHERPSTWSSLTNTINRHLLSGKFFKNDPDVFILRDKKTKLSEEQKNTLFVLNQLLGELLFTSDDIGDYDEQQMHQYGSAFPLCARSGVEIAPCGRNAYRIDFRIGIREYVLFTNLDKKPISFDDFEESTEYYDPENNTVQKLESLELAPYSTRCYYKIQNEDAELLGGKGHVFSGAEISRMQWNAPDQLRIFKHRDAVNKDPVYIRIQDKDLKAIYVNEEKVEVQQYGNFWGVKLELE